MRAKAVVDGQQAEIPVLQQIRTVGTRVESIGAEWRAARKQGSRRKGKSVRQCKDVMRTEIRVGKYMSHASRKAAIVYMIPVP